MKKISTRELAFLAICVILGLFAKRIVSPLTNSLTDFFRIPGGSAAVGFSLAFLVIGKRIAAAPFSASMMAFVQSVLALALGFSGYQGALALITYTLPGVVIDLTAYCMKKYDLVFCFLSCVLACLASALASNLLVFHLQGIALLLWLLLATFSGAIGGYLAQLISSRLVKIIQ
ncbi:MAG: hypothetical protein IKO00_00915 [Oscillospiraceae bacterium]|nr:hypothetical protein [Oscillospiraceae bacterium]